MSKEIHVKKRCPTVIARLLGKERISQQRHVDRQPKTAFPSYQFDVHQKSRQYNDFSSSRSSSNHEAFKDVYEDLGTSNSNRRTSTKWSANSMLTKHELALIQQNAEASSSRGSHHMAVLNLSDSIKYESNSKAWDLTDTRFTSHLPRRDGLLLEPHNSHNAHILCDSSRTLPEEKSEENNHPRKIVVLKPDSQNTSNGIVLKRTKDDRKEIEARRTARSVTRRLENRYASTDASCSEEYKGYEGDVSDSDAFRFSSRKSSGNSRLSRYPSSSLAESSSANKETKQRKCERWKITQEYQDLELAAGDLTLGEMLATDRERRSICISSRDGWKVEGSSLPSSKDKRSSHRINKSNKYLMDNDDVRKDGFSNRDSKSMIRKPRYCRNIFINEMDSYLEASFAIQMEANVKDTSEQHRMLQMVADDDTCKTTKHKGVGTKEATDGKASRNQQNTNSQELQKKSKLDSSASSKDAYGDRVSPVSVLQELPFPGDNASSSSSSYPCFERVSAALNELRMQLESLMIQPGDIASMDEEFVEFTPILYEGNYALRTLNWETSYTLDVLMGSGLESCDFDMFKTNWHSPEFPLDPTLFDYLENEYNGEATGLWSERKFLFDRINFALVEIFQEHVDLFPWMTRKLTGSSNRANPKDWIRVALQDKMYGDYVASQREVDMEMHLSDCKGEIEVICIEIEGLLIDDMIAEMFFKV